MLADWWLNRLNGGYFVDRLNNIANFRKNQEISEQNKKIEQELERERLIGEIKLLKPRIDRLLEVGNACQNVGISLMGKAWGGHEGYDTNQFFTNSWSHLVGFVGRGKDIPIIEMGINGGGACGQWNFRTDGIRVYEVSGEKTQGPQIHHMRKFLTNFDVMEKAFYDYVDKVTAKNKDVVPLEPEKTEKPVEISGNRLSVLVYNAIELLEDDGFTPKDLLEEIGITEKEYEAIVGRKVFEREYEGLDDKIALAEAERQEGISGRGVQDRGAR